MTGSLANHQPNFNISTCYPAVIISVLFACFACFAKEPQYHPAGSSYIGKYKNRIAKYIYLAYKWHIGKVFYTKIKSTV